METLQEPSGPSTPPEETQPRLIRDQVLHAFELAKTVTEKVENRLPLVKTGRESVEWLSAPLLKKAVEYGDPLVNKADDYVAQRWLTTTNEKGEVTTVTLSAKIQELQQDLANRIVGNKWFQKVDAEIRFQSLWEAARNQYAVSRNVSRQDFVDGFKRRVSTFTTGNVDALADFFWKNCNTLLVKVDGTSNHAVPVKDLDALKERLNEMWDLQVKSPFTDNILTPSVAVYQTGLASMIELKTKLGHTLKDAQAVSFSDFRQGMKQRLGHTYNETLEKPLLEFYDSTKTKAVEELMVLQARVKVVVDQAKASRDLTVGTIVTKTKDNLQALKSQGLNQLDATLAVPKSAYATILKKADTTLDHYLPPAAADGNTPADGNTTDSSSSESSSSSSSSSEGEEKGAQDEQEISLTSLSLRVYGGVKPLFKKLRTWGPIPRVEKEVSERILFLRQRAKEANAKHVEPKVLSIQEQLKEKYENFETTVKVPILKQRFKVVKDQANQAKTLASDYMSHRPIKEIPLDTVKFCFQMPLFVVALMLGTNPRQTEFHEVEQLGIGIFKSLWACALWWWPEKQANKSTANDPTTNEEVVPLEKKDSNRASPASSFDSIASGVSSPVSAEMFKKKKSKKKKKRSSKAKHIPQGSEPDLAQLDGDDEGVEHF
jgi:hypothetical protein